MPDLDHDPDAPDRPRHDRLPDTRIERAVGVGHDWGLTNRMNRLLDSESGRTVMLAFDHGYFQGPTAGLRRLDVGIPQIAPYADALMCTRGALRATIPAGTDKPVVLRVSGGQSVLKELSNEAVVVSVADAVRLNASAMAVQIYVGAPFEHESIVNLGQTVDAGLDHGIPTLAVTGVGRDMTRDSRYIGLASRITAETGAQLVKTYYIDEGFDEVVASCPVPILIAGGKKLPEIEALTMAYRAIEEGAIGVDMGRNIFQSQSPSAMIKAVRAVVHGGLPPAEAYELFEQTRHEASSIRV